MNFFNNWSREEEVSKAKTLCVLDQAKDRSIQNTWKPLQNTVFWCLSNTQDDEVYQKVRLTPKLPRVVLKPNSHSGQQDQQEQDARTSCDHPSGSKSFGETWCKKRWLQNTGHTPCASGRVSPQICAAIAWPPVCFILTGLAVVFVYPFALAFALTKLAFALVLVLFAFTRAGLACAFVIRATPSTCSGCFASVRFSVDSLSPCVRKFHTMNSFLGIFDLDCPSPTNHRNRLYVSSCQVIVVNTWSRKPPFSKTLMTTLILMRSDSVSFASCFQGMLLVAQNLSNCP